MSWRLRNGIAMQRMQNTAMWCSWRTGEGCPSLGLRFQADHPLLCTPNNVPDGPGAEFLFFDVTEESVDTVESCGVSAVGSNNDSAGLNVRHGKLSVRRARHVVD